MKKTETCGINMNSNFRFRILAKSESQNWFKNNQNWLVREVCDPKKWNDLLSFNDFQLPTVRSYNDNLKNIFKQKLGHT